MSKVSYDWGFGDRESALGAASHMGRREIARFLLKKNARPDNSTLATMGKWDAVDALVQALPGIQQLKGPHGVTLPEHDKFPLDQDILAGLDLPKQ